MGQRSGFELLLRFLSVFVEKIVSFKGLLLELPLSLLFSHECPLRIVVCPVEEVFRGEPTRFLALNCDHKLGALLLEVFSLEGLHQTVLHISHGPLVEFLN